MGIKKIASVWKTDVIFIFPARIRRVLHAGVIKMGKKEGKSMEMSERKPLLSYRVLYLPTDALHPNPHQPRRDFDEGALRELSESIRRYGILQPLTVRRTENGYELIAGERRLRAAKLAGLREVPCLLARSSEEESALLALIENLQRRDLHYLEEAAAIAQLIAAYGLSQEQAAENWENRSPPSQISCGCCACRPRVHAFYARTGFPSATPARCCALRMRRTALRHSGPSLRAVTTSPRVRATSSSF